MIKYKTEQRKILQDLFFDHPHELLSAKDIQNAIGKETISISTVYRNLAGLERDGLVRRYIKNGSKEAYYQYTGTRECRDHIHLTCERCGKTVHMALEDTNELVQSVSKYNNFSVDRSTTVLFGVCGACSAHRE